MDKYLLPLLLNNRRATILPLANEEATPKTIILDCDHHRLPMLQIAKSKMLQSLVLQKTDLPLTKLSFSFLVNGNDAILKMAINPNDINKNNAAAAKSSATHDNDDDDDDDDDAVFIPKTKQELNVELIQEVLPLHTMPGANIVFENGRDTIGLVLMINEQIKKDYVENNIINLTIILEGDDKNYTNKIKFAVATQSSLLNLGFDFGSEASQIRQRRYKRNGPDLQAVFTDVPLFDYIKAFKKETAKDEAYFQFEKDTPFLKSIFYTQKILHANSAAYEDQNFLTHNEELLVINKTQEADRIFEEKWKQLPNLKIAHKYGSLLYNYKLQLNTNGQIRTILLEDIKDKLYGTILKTILSAYFSNALYTDKAIDVKLTLLIPNIYDTYEIKRTAYIIDDIIASINESILPGKIRNYELITLSESDASFMGYYNLTEDFVEINKYYAIIDCGKGTTDFSIVKSDENIHEFKNLYRNGFAGAGNLMTYAFFEAFFYQLVYVSNNRINAKLFLANKLPNFSGADKSRLFDIMEGYKINYNANTQQTTVDDAFNSAKSGSISFANLFDDGEDITIETLFGLMKGINTCFNWNNNVSNATDTIIQGIASSLQKVLQTLEQNNTQCGGVLITGRGFLFKPLQVALEDALQKMGIPKNLIKYPSTNAAFKTICLNGVFRTSYSFNPDIMCLPIELMPKEEQTKTTPVANTETIEKKATNLFERIKVFWQKQVNDIVLGDIQKFSEEINVMNVQQNDFNKLRFIIGNNIFEPSDYNISQGDRKELIYDGRDFIIRTFNKNNVLDYCIIKPLQELANNNQEQVIPSLFPAILDKDNFDFLTANYKKFIPDEDDIFMPK